MLEGRQRLVTGTIQGRAVSVSLSVEDITVAGSRGPSLVAVRSGRARFTAYAEGSLAQGELEVLSVAEARSRLQALVQQTAILTQKLAAQEQQRATNRNRLDQLRATTAAASATLAQVRQHLQAAAQDGPSSDVSASGRAIHALLPALRAQLAEASGPRLAIADDLAVLTELVVAIIAPEAATLAEALSSSNSPNSANSSNSQAANTPPSPLDQALDALKQAVTGLESAVEGFVVAALEEAGLSSLATNILVGVVGDALDYLTGGSTVIAADTLASNVASTSNNLLSSVNQTQQSLDNVNRSLQSSSSEQSFATSAVAQLTTSLGQVVQTLEQQL